jgi:hypothetical protein
VSCLAFEGMAGIVAVVGWHPHFPPVTPMLALVFIGGLALIAGASWRIGRGPGRRRALSCLLIGAAPLWFLAGHFLHGAAANSGRNWHPDPLLRSLEPLVDSVMDLEARFRYPQWTYGEKVVMISSPMPEIQARAQVTAMDRHIRALEARLGRPTRWTIRWVRGPLFGVQGAAFRGLCLGSMPGESWADAEGLAPTDRHEVAHCVLASHCRGWFDAPAVLVEGWAESNMSNDVVLQARIVKERFDRGNRGAYQSEFTYDRHEGLPALRSVHATTTAPDGALKTMDLKFVERRFDPVPEEEFDPDRFLDGQQTTITDTDTDEPSALQRFSWLPFPIGALCLVIGAAISLTTRRKAP